GPRQARQPAQPAGLHGPEAAVPGEDGRERRHPAAVLLRRQLELPAELRSCELRRIRMSRRASRLLVAAVFAALVTPVAAGASLSLRGIDTSGYPTVRVTVVAPVARTAAPPTLTENGNRVVGLRAVNLAATKSVVSAIDRSRSMKGTKLSDALEAARAFLLTKAPSDKVSVVGFGSRAVQLTPFTQSTAEADDALRLLRVDPKNGTALYDALQLSASSLRNQMGRARVVVLLTDGKDVSSESSLKAALGTAHDTGTLVYPIAIGGDGATVAPLKQMAAVTGGSFKSAATSSSLNAVYSSIAGELKRTWRVEYATAARPGEQLHLRVSMNPEGAASTDVRIPGTPTEDAGGEAPPHPLYSPLGGLLLTMLVAFLVLTACGFLFSSAKGSWVKTRLAPHVESRKTRKRQKGERLAALGGLSRATERAFGPRRIWHKLQRKLERADLPLRTVEFAYLIVGRAFVVAFFAAASGPPSVQILVALAVGGAIPYLFVSFKAKSRMNAFEDQLPDLLVTLAASLKAGHSFKQGIQTIVDEGHEPASKELGRVLTDSRLGRPMDEALSETAERIGSKNFSFVITAV